MKSAASVSSARHKGSGKMIGQRGGERKGSILFREIFVPLKLTGVSRNARPVKG